MCRDPVGVRAAIRPSAGISSSFERPSFAGAVSVQLSSAPALRLQSARQSMCVKILIHLLPVRKLTETATKEELRERSMVDFERSTPPTRIQYITKRKLLQLGMASALAGMLVAPSDAQARITKIEMSKPVLAFGGYSFPGVGQYEVITGIATGEVNPSNPQNAVITDIKLAPKNANGNVVYQHNFYILKPVDLKQGNHKMMYEPPNRGGKTYQTLNNTPTVHKLPGPQ